MSGWEEDGKVCVREIKRLVDRAVKVPSDLVERISRAAAHSHAAWVEARKNSNFKEFEPHLQNMLDLRIEEAQALGYANRPYDAMIDLFEPYATERSIGQVFDELRGELVPFVQAIAGAEKKSDALIHGPSFPEEKQRAFGLKVVEAFGFDFEAGRQDSTVHPFCAGTLGDVRITTRFYPDDLRPAIFGMMHEAGHGLYEQGYSPDHRGTPLAQAVSLAVHESQSRLWENLVGRSLPFWKGYFPVLQETFPEALGSASLMDFYEAINIIEGSLIRVEADEATYQLHIILRFELESDLVNRRVAVADLPEAWNDKMDQFLGVTVPGDAEGVLQDVHWSEGLFGYFPTYCLGNIYSAQLFNKAARDIDGLEKSFEKGNFQELLSWLRTNIHSQGRRYPAEVLLERVTGEKPSARYLMDYLRRKFGPLYGL
jgi:carboxypeptidase Taq